MRTAPNSFRNLFLILILIFVPSLASAETQPEPDTYRTEKYRGPVPETLKGAEVVNTEQAYELWESGEISFIDVMPQAPKPDNLPKGTVWREKKRISIEGAIWLPNVGYGEIAEQTHEYFKAGLVKATGGNFDKPILLFCLSECWMSWNAAKRALEYGYKVVYWYPDGTDGWEEFLHPTAQVQPEGQFQ